MEGKSYKIDLTIEQLKDKYISSIVRTTRNWKGQEENQEEPVLNEFYASNSK